MYEVNTGRKNKRFNTLEAAKKFVEKVFQRTGIVLSIIEVVPKHHNSNWR